MHRQRYKVFRRFWSGGLAGGHEAGHPGATPTNPKAVLGTYAHLPPSSDEIAAERVAALIDWTNRNRGWRRH